MSLRLSLVLVIILAYASIGTVLVLKNPVGSDSTSQPPFFYRLDSEDIRHISIETGGEEIGWHYREDERRWYFDDLQDIPANLFRWGGITTLLGGPRTQRVLEETIDDPAVYGLDDPNTVISVTIRDGNTVTLHLGNETPDGGGNYAQVIGYPQLVLVDASWGFVLDRLVTEPPVPDWYYTMDPNRAREILFFLENEVVEAYGFNRDDEQWYLCDLPVIQDPCTGTQLADEDALIAAMEHFGNPEIGGVEAIDLQSEEEFEPYDASANSPYIAIRIEERQPNGVTEVTRTSMTIGAVTPDGEYRYAVANETSDVIKVDKEWADQVLALFEPEPMLAEPGVAAAP
ncbi:MAG: DUF4340 domain-containing protein [Dehalococcoidia bacterium]